MQTRYIVLLAVLALGIFLLLGMFSWVIAIAIVLLILTQLDFVTGHNTWLARNGRLSISLFLSTVIVATIEYHLVTAIFNNWILDFKVVRNLRKFHDFLRWVLILMVFGATASTLFSRVWLKKIIIGYRAAAFFFGFRIMTDMDEGPVLYPGAVVQVDWTPQVTVIPNQTEDGNNGDEGLLAQIRVDSKKNPNDGVTLGNFNVKVRIGWNPVDLGLILRFLRKGESDETVLWENERGISTAEKLDIERTFMLGPGLEALRRFFAQRNYFFDFCGVTEDEIDDAEKNKVALTFIDETTTQEIIDGLNAVAESQCGIQITSINIEKITPADDATKTAISGATAEVGEKAKEKLDAATRAEIMKMYLKVTGGKLSDKNPDEVFLAWALSAAASGQVDVADVIKSLSLSRAIQGAAKDLGPALAQMAGEKTGILSSVLGAMVDKLTGNPRGNNRRQQHGQGNNPHANQQGGQGNQNQKRKKNRRKGPNNNNQGGGGGGQPTP